MLTGKLGLTNWISQHQLYYNVPLPGTARGGGLRRNTNTDGEDTPAVGCSLMPSPSIYTKMQLAPSTGTSKQVGRLLPVTTSVLLKAYQYQEYHSKILW